MKFLTSVVALATMASTTLACHCRTGSGGFDMDTTKVCYPLHWIFIDDCMPTHGFILMQAIEERAVSFQP
ncbi:hypothetical protein E4U19_002999 [Claviceps sp. Clav32 group G5]|nr:hypothetical protein E4U19_002999 [Claviceps sp. Clav32 group G5]KAG6044590.1 hypothetical protein E4U39_003204 [Claviceps sp. Clav50 group G5]